MGFNTGSQGKELRGAEAWEITLVKAQVRRLPTGDTAD
jgi:hypothetical protein